jgi:hypothetical protein
MSPPPDEQYPIDNERCSDGPFHAAEPRFILATKEKRQMLKKERRGRHQKRRLDTDDLLLLNLLIKKKRIKVRELASSLGCCRQQVYRVLKGGRGWEDGADEILSSMLVGHHAASHNPKGGFGCSPTGLPFLRIFGFDPNAELAKCTGQSFLKLDYLTSWAHTEHDPNSDFMSKLVTTWRSIGFKVNDYLYVANATDVRGFLWGFTVQGEGFDFRAFRKRRGKIGFNRDIRLELKGQALASGKGPQIFETFMAPLVEQCTLRVTRLDVAFDIDCPLDTILPFREWMPTREPKGRKSYNSIFRNLRTHKPNSLYIGRRGSPLAFIAYDKLNERNDRLGGDLTLSDLAALPGLSHTHGWNCCTRLEARIMPNQLKIKNLGYDPELMLNLPNPFKKLHLLHLPTVPLTDVWRFFIYLAKACGPEDLAVAWFHDHREARDAFRRRLFHYATLWPFVDPAESFEVARTRLQGDLNSIIQRTLTTHDNIPPPNPYES